MNKANNVYVTEVTKSNLKECLNLDIIAFHWAACGACGEGGAVVFITSEGKVYHSNYVYPGYIDKEDLFRVFPPLSEFRPGLFGGGYYPPEWKDQYLGLGNYLVINASFWEAFTKIADKELIIKNTVGDRVILYNIWVEVVLKVLSSGKDSEAI